MTQFLAGQILTARMLSDLEELAVPLYARKLFDEGVTSSIVLQPDNDLLLPISANATYTMTGLLFVTCTTDTGDIQVGFSFPSGARIDYAGWGPHIGSISGSGGSSSGGIGEWVARAGQTTSPTQTSPYGAAQLVTSVNISGLVTTGATAGSLTLMWTQQLAAGTTTVKAGSWLRLERVA